MLNKQGKWVPDQKTIYLNKKKEDEKAGQAELMEMTKELCAAAAEQSDESATQESSKPSALNARAEQAEALRQRMKEIFKM